MSIHKDIQSHLREAMMEKDVLKVTVLRGIIAALMNEIIAKKTAGSELPDADVVNIIKRLAKQRKDSIAQFKQGGRNDLVKNEEAELKILEIYLPQTMSKTDILKFAKAKKVEMGISDKAKVGQLVGAVMKELKGKADGGDVKKVVEGLF